MYIAILCENQNTMKNLKKYIAITLVTLLVGLLTISVTNTPHSKSHRVYERPVFVEEWMTKPFSDSVDEPLELVEFMTKPFIAN